MSIFDEQISRKPDRYPWTKDFIKAMWESLWTPEEFTFHSDLHDYKVNMNEQEREIVVRTLSAISQIEIAVKRFWANIGNTLPHPSIIDMGLVMANIEVTHNRAYEKLLDVLGITEVFEENLKTEVIGGRVTYLRKYLDKVYRDDDKKQFVYSLILFTLFIENVSLFSQFYIIAWFNRYKNILKDAGQQIIYTSREENCFIEGTEVLTPQGWKDFREINVGDDVVEYRTDGTFKFTKVLHKTVKPYNGQLIQFDRIENRCVVTPEHEMVCFTGRPDKIKPVKKQAKDVKFHKQMRLPNGAQLLNKGISELSFEDRLRIAIQANGSTAHWTNNAEKSVLRGMNGGCTHCISLVQQRKKDRLEWILNNCNISYNTTPGPNGNLMYRFPYNHDYNYKEFDWIDLTDKTIEWCREFIKEIVEWDGFKENGHVGYCSINKRNIDIVQTIGIFAGYITNIIEGRERVGYKLHFMTTDNNYIPISHGIKKSFVEYDGFVYCVTVPSGNIMTRYQNKTFIAGNCHALIGMKLVNVIREEFPELFDKDLEDKITSEALVAFNAESKIIDWMVGDFKGERISGEILKEYIKERINRSLVEIGYSKLFDIDPNLERDFEWFDEEVDGNVVTDFFNRRDTGYVKNSYAFSEEDLF